MVEAKMARPAMLTSGTRTDAPPQRRLSDLDPAGSDEADSDSNPTWPVSTGSGEAQDYLNGGVPHERVSPDAPVEALMERRRRSVQFARGDVVIALARQQTQNGSWDVRDPMSRMRGSGSGFMARLKGMASPSAGGSPAVGPRPCGSEANSPSSSAAATRRNRGEVRSEVQDEGSDIDADTEETADEEAGGGDCRQKKRRMRRRKHDGRVSPSLSAADCAQRCTMPEAGLSEGEGRDQVKRRGHRRGSSWAGRDGGEDGNEVANVPGRRGTGHLRRLSMLTGGVSDGDAVTAKRPLFGGGEQRASTFGAHRWRQVKKTIRALRPKKETPFDLHKSTELMAELRAGAPAVLMLASMLQRDEHGNRRIPVLLEQVKLHITDSHGAQDKEGKNSERHWLFTIELEYGSGPSRMRWTIKRTIKEILNLHWKYKFARNENPKLPATTRLEMGPRVKQPTFPLSAFPYLRGARGLDGDEEEDAPESQPAATPRAGNPAGGEPDKTAEATGGEATAAEGTASDGDARRQRRKASLARIGKLYGRRKQASLADGNGSRADVSQVEVATARRRYVERQRRRLEKYLQEMVRWLMFRPDSNRLCRFLELSALGVRLAAEGSYHGKECYLHIKSSKGLDFRRVLRPGTVIERHSRKWFLVRQSYIVCVDSPENMNIYDVYLVDAKFKMVSKKNKAGRGTGMTEAITMEDGPAAKHHTLKMQTSERTVTLFSRNQHLMQQFEESIGEMLRTTPWHLRNRFDSYAPVRSGIHVRWLVDGRDYMWNVSRALNMAKDVIYMHDWWLSPELYMRRPAAISQKWRLDRLLQRKAEAGVKIFVILYRNVEAAIPIDSEYTKFSLLNLHPNVFVQRSPHQFKKNQFFFAHHEKICIVDHHVAFLGGIDLCFGRWDTPQHPATDDKPTGFEDGDSPKDAEHCQLFPGKDYSNARVQDFFGLAEPYEEMHDRTKVPRMPWHDIGMQVVGQPARDLTRHFVQRWNYLRRGRKPTRPTPFLLPPPDYSRRDMDEWGINGSCEVQICRSASTWSLGMEETEHSIQSAYVRLIRDSDHLVYMENQFFITSTETMGVRIVNPIGDALVERIMRAHAADEDWRAIVLIPLMPGFQNEVNEQDGTSVRLILQCQYRSICRGEHSVFGRLRAAGIDPEDYIEFFSLRAWGKLGSLLATEQLYIHAKCIIVDDRTVLLGSANINERSMLGNRDSEVAAVVTDRDMMPSSMAGRPYRVGRFAHTLRLRLMREHMGLDVDAIADHERDVDAIVDEIDGSGHRKRAAQQTGQASDADESVGRMHTEINDLVGDAAAVTAAAEGAGPAQLNSILDICQAHITSECMTDPLDPAFYDDVWCRVAENNTRIFRRVFRVMPDSEATSWAEYKEYKAYQQRFQESMQSSGDEQTKPGPSQGRYLTAPRRRSATNASSGRSSSSMNERENVQVSRLSGAMVVEKTEAFPPLPAMDAVEPADETPDAANGRPTANSPTAKSGGSQRPTRRRRATTRASRRGVCANAADEMLTRHEAEGLLKLTQGALVQFPYDWLAAEEANGNWLFQVDQVAPLQIYN